MDEKEVSMHAEEILCGDALICLYRIKGDRTNAEEEITHSHSYYEIHYLTNGEYTYSIDKNFVSVKAGEMIIIKPDVLHKAARLLESEKLLVLPISIRKVEGSRKIYSAMVSCLDDHAAVPVCVSNLLPELIRTLDKKCESVRLLDVLRRKKLVFQIMETLLQCLSFADDTFVPVEYPDFDVMLETYIFNSRLPLYEIAHKMGYSQRQISRKIFERFGKTFSQIRRELR